MEILFSCVSILMIIFMFKIIIPSGRIKEFTLIFHRRFKFDLFSIVMYSLWYFRLSTEGWLKGEAFIFLLLIWREKSLTAPFRLYYYRKIKYRISCRISCESLIYGIFCKRWESWMTLRFPRYILWLCRMLYFYFLNWKYDSGNITLECKAERCLARTRNAAPDTFLCLDSLALWSWDIYSRSTVW